MKLGRNIKLGDLEIYINGFERDVIGGNIINWVRDNVAKELAGEFIKRHGEKILKAVRVDEADLRARVQEKMADEIIENWVRSVEGWK